MVSKLALTQTGGEHVLQAVAALGEFESDAALCPLLLGTYEPSFNTPAPGRRVRNPLLCTGEGRLGDVQVVSWFNPDVKLLPVTAVRDGKWSGEADQSLREGGQWLRLRQTLEDGDEGPVSAWVNSQRFEIDSAPSSETPGLFRRTDR